VSVGFVLVFPVWADSLASDGTANRMAGPEALCHHEGVTTVLIVDDHPSFRSSAHALLEAEGFEVVGEASDGASAIEAVERLHPDVVLLDVQLPDIDGFAVARQLAEIGASAAIVLTSSRSIASVRWRLEANPDWRFIPKSELSGDALGALVG
jgi:DNA-binding NarL/FixJ family response regulator